MNHLRGLLRQTRRCGLGHGSNNGLAIKGIVGDVTYGDNSDLYEVCGYIGKSEKKEWLDPQRSKKWRQQPKAKKTPPAS